MGESKETATGGSPGKADISIKTEISSEVWTDLSKFFVRLAGPFAEGADFLSDKIRYFRLNSAIRVLMKARQLAGEAGIEPSAVPVKFLVPFMESCSLEEEESSLADQWANLLVSACENYDDRHATFVSILSQIGGRDAKLLKAIWAKDQKAGLDKLQSLLSVYGRDADETTWDGNTVVSLDSHDQEPSHLVMAGSGSMRAQSRIWDHDGTASANIESIMILERQNLIKIKAQHGVHSGGGGEVYVISVALTPLGFDFVSACERPSKPAAHNRPQNE